MKPMLGALLLLGYFSVGVSAQTIADLARQERARRQSQQKSPVITTQMIRSTPATTTDVTPAAETEKSEAPEPTPPAEPAGDTRDEKWWRDAFTKAREEVKRAEDRIAVLDNELKTVNREFLQRSFDPNNFGPRAIADTTARLEAAKKDLDTARGKVSQLEEDMRRAGAPPGWIR
jgi:hypothetical protein